MPILLELFRGSRNPIFETLLGYSLGRIGDASDKISSSLPGRPVPTHFLKVISRVGRTAKVDLSAIVNHRQFVELVEYGLGSLVDCYRVG